MRASTSDILSIARNGGYAVGAFNVYNLEGVQAVIEASETEGSPVMLQLHPAALNSGGSPLVALCLEAADSASVPVSVHLDHSSSVIDIRRALEVGVGSVMADGSAMPYEENLAFTKSMASIAHEAGAALEAELGRIGGTEDGLTVSELEARFTDPVQASEFVSETGVDALAVCIGNVHGKYHSRPNLDFERLRAIGEHVSVPLVLHGASGLPGAMVREAIQLGIVKLNVNTGVRQAYIGALKDELSKPGPPDLLDLMRSAVEAMRDVVAKHLRLFGSSGKA